MAMPWGSTKEVTVGRAKRLSVSLEGWGRDQTLLCVFNLGGMRKGVCRTQPKGKCDSAGREARRGTNEGSALAEASQLGEAAGEEVQRVREITTEWKPHSVQKI